MMTELNVKENILKVNQEINDLYFISSDFLDWHNYNLLITFLTIVFLGGIIALYAIFYIDLLENINKENKYDLKIKKSSNILANLLNSLLALSFIVISIMSIGVIIDTINKNNIEDYVEENKEELRDMFTASNQYEITNIKSLKYNYFITYKDNDKTGQILTDEKVKIKNSDSNIITFYQTQDTLKLINEMVLDGIEINPSLKKAIKYDLFYYEVESNSVNK